MNYAAILCTVLAVGISGRSLGSELLIWGQNRNGRMTNLVIHLPHAISDKGAKCVKLCPTGMEQYSIGKLGAIILTSDQTVISVGAANPDYTPPPGLKNVIDIAVGFNCGMAVTSNGNITVWGGGQFPTNRIPVGLTNVVGIAGGMGRSLALSSNGSITCWTRWNSIGTWKGLDRIKAVSISQDLFSVNGAALAQDGGVFQWHKGAMASPIPEMTNIVAISASPSHYLALTKDSTVLSRLSNGDMDKNIPSGLTNVVAIATGLEYVGAEAAAGFSLVLKSDGTLAGWGHLGKNDLVPPNIGDVVAIAAGDGFCMAITTNSAVAEQFLRNDSH